RSNVTLRPHKIHIRRVFQARLAASQMGGMISIQDALLNELCDYLRVFGTKRNSFPPRRNGRAYRHSSVSPFENSNFEASKASPKVTTATLLLRALGLLHALWGSPPTRECIIEAITGAHTPLPRIFSLSRLDPWLIRKSTFSPA